MFTEPKPGEHHFRGLTNPDVMMTIFILPEESAYSCSFVRPYIHHTFIQSVSLKVLKVI